MSAIGVFTLGGESGGVGGVDCASGGSFAPFVGGSEVVSLHPIRITATASIATQRPKRLEWFVFTVFLNMLYFSNNIVSRLVVYAFYTQRPKAKFIFRYFMPLG
jgi:hypothetical protein